MTLYLEKLYREALYSHTFWRVRGLIVSSSRIFPRLLARVAKISHQFFLNMGMSGLIVVACAPIPLVGHFFWDFVTYFFRNYRTNLTKFQRDFHNEWPYRSHLWPYRSGANE